MALRIRLIVREPRRVKIRFIVRRRIKIRLIVREPRRVKIHLIVRETKPEDQFFSSSLIALEDIPDAAPPTLPPSVEEAYRRKCIDLTHRLSEVEQNNDELRLRRLRLIRGIRKMRMERALLLEALGKRMRKNGAEGPLGNKDDDSEDSSENPPTVEAPTENHQSSPKQSNALTSRKPQERPLRTKKSHRRLGESPQSTAREREQGSASGLAGEQNHPRSSDFSTTAGPAPAENGESYVKEGRSRSASPSRSTRTAPSLPMARPLTPREMFSRHLLKEVLPSNPNMAAEISLSFDGDSNAYAEYEWAELGREDKQRWTDKYEEAMDEWTRAEDARKKERSQGYRENRGRHQHHRRSSIRERGGTSAAAGDVEMAEAGDADSGDEN